MHCNFRILFRILFHILGDIRNGPPITANELQSLIKDGSLLTTTRMNKDGGWEKVVTIENDINRPTGRVGSSASQSQEEERFAWTKQSQAAVIEEEVRTVRAPFDFDIDFYGHDYFCFLCVHTVYKKIENHD